MAIAEIIEQNKHAYIVFENGKIKKVENSKFKAPCPPRFFEPPSKPEKSGDIYHDTNLWGERLSSVDVADIVWRKECANIEELNAIKEHEWQSFQKKKLMKIKWRYRMQQTSEFIKNLKQKIFFIQNEKS